MYAAYAIWNHACSYLLPPLLVARATSTFGGPECRLALPGDGMVATGNDNLFLAELTDPLSEAVSLISADKVLDRDFAFADSVGAM